ncbi:MAG: ribose 5-phosphate isomerase B [Deltaproteobacteria bacterium]|nr:ribose 5-phosphate isomerase B [Deltaproteobacteria bacterium]
MKIVIGSDHGGFELKEDLKHLLSERSLEVVDMGTDSESPVDYPDIGGVVAEKVSAGEFERGVLICGTGIGMSIVANRFPGVRAALCQDVFTARLSREHNDSNLLVLGGRTTGKGLAREIFAVWLETKFQGGRHERRLEKIHRLETKINEEKINDKKINRGKS